MLKWLLVLFIYTFYYLQQPLNWRHDKLHSKVFSSNSACFKLLFSPISHLEVFWINCEVPSYMCYGRRGYYNAFNKISIEAISFRARAQVVGIQWVSMLVFTDICLHSALNYITRMGDNSELNANKSPLLVNVWTVFSTFPRGLKLFQENSNVIEIESWEHKQNVYKRGSFFFI